MTRRAAPTLPVVIALVASMSLHRKGIGAQSAPSVPRPTHVAMFGGDARHTGRTARRGPRAPVLRWRVRTTRRVFASPVVDALGRAVVGSLDGSVIATDAAGVVRASVVAPSRVFASPAALGELVIYGHDARAFVALDARGRVAWQLPMSQDADAPPTVGPGPTVYLASEAVVAVDGRGAPRWQRVLGAHAFGAPALAGDALVVTDLSGGVTWLEVRDGAVRRRVATPAPIYGGALVLDDDAVVVAGDDGHLRAFSPDGTVRWDHATDGAARGLGIRATPALRRDGVIVVGAEDGGIYGVRAADGARVFRLATGFPVRSSACIDADDVAYLGGEDDAVHAVGPDGQERWRVTLGADVDSSPTLLADGLLVVGCDDGALYALGDDAAPTTR